MPSTYLRPWSQTLAYASFCYIGAVLLPFVLSEMNVVLGSGEGNVWARILFWYDRSSLELLITVPLVAAAAIALSVSNFRDPVLLALSLATLGCPVAFWTLGNVASYYLEEAAWYFLPYSIVAIGVPVFWFPFRSRLPALGRSRMAGRIPGPRTGRNDDPVSRR